MQSLWKGYKDHYFIFLYHIMYFCILYYMIIYSKIPSVSIGHTKIYTGI